jgi:uncharacterized membrane protein
MMAFDFCRYRVMRLIIGYVATLVIFCIFDFVWLGFIAKGFYRAQIGGLLLAQPNWAAAILFYVLYAAGIQMFCVIPALDGGTASKAALLGALFGFFCYMTYDLSNLATLKDWALRLSIIDIVWGAFVTAVAALTGFSAVRALSPPA